MANLSNNRISAVISDADMATIMADIKEIESKIPGNIGLTPTERQAMPKISWDNKQFTDDAVESIKANPEFLPRYLVAEEIVKDYDLFVQLMEVEYKVRVLHQRIYDTRLLAGSENYSACLAFYRSVKQAAIDGVPGAKAIYEALRRRFENQGPKPKAEDGDILFPDDDTTSRLLNNPGDPQV